MNKQFPTLDKLREAIKGKLFLSASQVVELGLVDSSSTLSLWRAKGIGPRCVRLSGISEGKYLYPTEELLEYIQSSYLPKNASQVSEDHSDKEPTQENHM
jgi:hypothetical protein